MEENQSKNVKEEDQPDCNAERAQWFIAKYFRYITGIILPIIAFTLMIYEIVLIAVHAYNAPGYSIEPKYIFHALILSTTTVAFIGMHRAVHKLILPKSNDVNHGKLTNVDILFFLTLMANAILLAGLIIVHEKYFPEKQYIHTTCCNEELNEIDIDSDILPH